MEFIFHTVELFNLSLYILDFASIIESTMSNSTIDLTTPYESKNETHTSETMASESTTSQSKFFFLYLIVSQIQRKQSDWKNYVKSRI